MSIGDFLRRLLGPDEPPRPTPPTGRHRVRFRSPERPEDPVIEPDGYTVQMEMSLHTVASLFASHGWQLARPGAGPQPSPQEIGTLLAEMIVTLDESDVPDGASSFYQFARFVAVRSDEFPDDIDLYLHIGTATRDNADSEPRIDPGELL